MKHNHTPGPWRLDGPAIYIFGPNNEVIAMVRGAGEGLPERDNGLLLAGAPELLDALIKLANEAAGFLSLSDIERHGMTNSRILRDRIEQARDVIAKVSKRTSKTGDSLEGQ